MAILKLGKKNCMIADWKPEQKPNMDEEIEGIKKWLQDRDELLDIK